MGNIFSTLSSHIYIFPNTFLTQKFTISFDCSGINELNQFYAIIKFCTCLRSTTRVRCLTCLNISKHEITPRNRRIVRKKARTTGALKFDSFSRDKHGTQRESEHGATNRYRDSRRNYTTRFDRSRDAASLSLFAPLRVQQRKKSCNAITPAFLYPRSTFVKFA